MPKFNRRTFLTTGICALASTVMPKRLSAESDNVVVYHLSAQSGVGYFQGAPYPRSAIWCYNQLLPGPEIRAKQGQRLRIELINALNQPTTLHCHGIRLPNAMDGVPGLTQKPVNSGESFVYEFDVPDAGTFWYHPHVNSSEQVGRGLYGALIVDETLPPIVDRDLTLILDDWRLDNDHQIQDNFNNGHDRSHGGRIGNTITVNGRIKPKIEVRSGERIRLRVINAANARTFVLDFSSHHTQVIAIDGQPVSPHKPENGHVILAAAMRMDLILDMTAPPKNRFVIKDHAYRNEQPDILEMIYNDQETLRKNRFDTEVRLPSNNIPEPDLDRSIRHEIVFAGGAMGGLRGAKLNGEYKSIRQLAAQGMLWALNGEIGVDHGKHPLFDLKRNQSCVLKLINNTVFDHPMHLHGYAFRVLSRNGQPTRYREWQDTVLVSRNETVEIGFVADNPGNWMLHCHILEHQISGMTGFIRVG